MCILSSVHMIVFKCLIADCNSTADNVRVNVKPLKL
jgi:hypothetical protein